MAPDPAREPPPSAYRGAPGRTQVAVAHVAGPRGELVPVPVHVGIDAAADPELAARLLDEDPAHALNVVQLDGAPRVEVAVPVVFHDPAAARFVLVLSESHRHRELEERIALLERLRADPMPVPVYVKEARVVYGAAGLRELLATTAGAGAVGAPAPRPPVSAREAAVAAREAAVAAREAAVAAREAAVAAREAAAARADDAGGAGPARPGRSPGGHDEAEVTQVEPPLAGAAARAGVGSRSAIPRAANDPATELGDDPAEGGGPRGEVAPAARAAALDIDLEGSDAAALLIESVVDPGEPAPEWVGPAAPATREVPELLAALAASGGGDRADAAARLAAALALCERPEPRAATAVIGAAGEMGRADAVRVLGLAVKLGDAALAPLLEGLGSSRAYVRHGAALALAVLRAPAGIQAVIELLLTEPTEIWREIARAIGRIGAAALPPLASELGRLGPSAERAIVHRAEVALAHVAVRGGRGAVAAMAGGHSVVAPVAQRALRRCAAAARPDAPPAGLGSEPDVSVNRTFSRRFFEALELAVPEVARVEIALLDRPAIGRLDDPLLLDEDEELDEADLLGP